MTRHRCSTCGATENVLLPESRPAECRKHPAVWTKWGTREARALYYVCERSRAGVDVARWIESSPESDHTGSFKTELRAAWTFAQRWQLPEMQPGQQSMISLFGRKTAAV